MQEKNNILRIFQETKQALGKEDIIKLKDLSNQTIHTASITQDPDNIVIAVIIYTLSKIIERKENYGTKPGWNRFYKGVLAEISNSINILKKGDDKHLRSNLQRLRKKVEGVSGQLKKYIKDVFIKARINKASRIYEHGISMEATASLLGITMFDLASYAGQTGISDVPLGQTMDTKTRIKVALEMFA
ncbi:MAG: hypothetical protein KKF48_01895 [Nanoarchaeota archaeon]|nr:hypothetical protein [Nanoarchaeota archaeon]MBU1027772.1 hypothetical protein [Nanoarchaeota archaeon]